MAVLNQIELPNGTTYDISDASARKLDNNDFDTINVTELNAGDVIVTGAARFLNTINGDISGNAETATSATKATQDESGNNIKNSYASSFSISDHTITLKNKNGTSLGTVTVPDNNTTYTVATGTANGKIKVTPSSGSAYEVSVYGLKSAAYKDVTDSYSATGTDPVSGKAVAAAIDALPEPMVFKGTVGDGGTVTWGNLPAPATTNEGHTYKVTTAKTKEQISTLTQDVKLGDTIISNKVNWVVIPSGDEPSGTVTNVAISNGGGLSVSGSPITSSGTITISHADTSSQASVDNSGRTYIQDISLDTYGHVTKITSATETVVNTDRYVNSAAFADATSADANNPVKMTLTRAGSDTASVTAYLPKVSSSSAGVAPKGAAVSTQSQSTKFLREDGTWATPSYTSNTNTTYTIGTNGNTVTLTPSSGSVQSITVPYATSAGSATDNTRVLKAGDTMTGKLIVPKTKIANTCYGVSFGKTTSTPVETIIKTGIKWVSSAHMPVIHLTGYAYGLKSPVEFKIGFYIYSNKVCQVGAVNMGSWEPDVYLYKYTRDSVDYVAVGLAGSCYYLQLQADVQDEMSKLVYVVLDDANWSWEFYTDTGHIPTPDDGTTCLQVPYKANILNGIRNVSINGNYLRVNNNGTNTDLTIPYATSATTASKLGSSNVGSATQPIYLSAGTATACTYSLGKSVPSDAVFTDTKNTAGSTDTSSKIFLIGATSQAANPQTYSDNEVYVTSGVVTTKSVQVGGGAATMEYDTTTQSINFIFN